MSTVSISAEKDKGNRIRFRAIAEGYETFGATMGEALDALTAQVDMAAGAVVLLQKYAPDDLFSAPQYARMQELLTRRPSLTETEQAELEELVDAELEAAALRTQPHSLLQTA